MPQPEPTEYWICCEPGDGITSHSDLPCGKRNSLQESICKRCGNWICDSCQFVRNKKPKEQTKTMPKMQAQVRPNERRQTQQVRRKPVPQGRLPAIVEEKPKSKQIGNTKNTTGAGAKVYSSKFHEEL